MAAACRQKAEQHVVQDNVVCVRPQTGIEMDYRTIAFQAGG